MWTKLSETPVSGDRAPAIDMVLPSVDELITKIRGTWLSARVVANLDNDGGGVLEIVIFREELRPGREGLPLWQQPGVKVCASGGRLVGCTTGKVSSCPVEGCTGQRFHFRTLKDGELRKCCTKVLGGDCDHESTLTLG